MLGFGCRDDIVLSIEHTWRRYTDCQEMVPCNRLGKVDVLNCFFPVNLWVIIDIGILFLQMVIQFVKVRSRTSQPLHNDWIRTEDLSALSSIWNIFRYNVQRWWASSCMLPIETSNAHSISSSNCSGASVDILWNISDVPGWDAGVAGIYDSIYCLKINGANASIPWLFSDNVEMLFLWLSQHFFQSFGRKISSITSIPQIHLNATDILCIQKTFQIRSRWIRSIQLSKRRCDQ